MRCLLDKVTARRILEGLLKLVEAREMTEDELFALDLYRRAEAGGLQLFIAPPTDSILKRLEALPRYSTIIRLFRNHAEVAFPSQYFKRWVRRLQDHGFTREDAAILALGTFSTNKDGSIIGMHFVVTLDRPMIQQWTMQYANIQNHLAAMQANLTEPYRQAPLPQVQFPQHVNRQLS